jgi:lipoteichoic acid synthase
LPQLMRRCGRALVAQPWFLIAYTGSALVFKSVLLIAFIVNPPFHSPDVAEASDWIPSLAVYASFAVIAVSPSVLFGNAAARWYLILLNVAFSALLLTDLWYYRAFMRLASLQHLRQTANLRSLSPAIISFVDRTDFLFALDAVIVALLLIFWKRRAFFRTSFAGFFLMTAIPSAFLYEFNANHPISEVSLFAIRWNPVETVSALSPVGYHLYDVAAFWTERKALELTAEDRTEIDSWLAQNQEILPPNRYRGIFSGYNLVLLQCESLENFVIGKNIGGQALTPNLNWLAGNSLYFRNFMEQVADGTSSDAEFMANTSVYPLPNGSVAWRYPRDTFNSLPKILKGRGYWTVDIHPDPGSYWNWAEFMTTLGMDECIDDRGFERDEVIDLGLSDGSLLRQVVPVLRRLRQPFYAFMITVTNHIPYDLPPEHRSLKLDPELDKTEIGGYLQSVHYMDRHIGAFLSNLRASGLLENTVVVIYGDHCGIHKFSLDALSKLSDHDKLWMENGSRVPLIVYKKGLSHRVFDLIGGQIDLMPTIAYLMGVDPRELTGTMGRNLLNTRKSFAVLYDGEFISAAEDPGEKDRVQRGMELADKIIRSDYFKTNRPPEFPPKAAKTSN